MSDDEVKYAVLVGIGKDDVEAIRELLSAVKEARPRIVKYVGGASGSGNDGKKVYVQAVMLKKAH